MEKKDLDWGNLGFNYMPCDYSYVCNYKDGAWEEGGLTEDHTLTLSEDAGIFRIQAENDAHTQRVQAFQCVLGGRILVLL